jgi:membrane-bound ClpP family serine protease
VAQCAVGNRLSETARAHSGISNPEVRTMLYTLAVVLLVLWLLGLVSSYTMGGFIHILLVIAIIVVLVNIINGRRRL